MASGSGEGFDPGEVARAEAAAGGALPATIAYAALGSATARGDTFGMSLAGVMIATLGVGGSVGTYLVWRRRPRKQQAAATASMIAAAPVSAAPVSPAAA